MQSLFGDYFNSSAYHELKISQSVVEQVEHQEWEMIDVLDSLSTSNYVRFSDFDLNKTYPYFIFRNGRLLVWSDYHLVPEYSAVAGKYVYRSLILNEGFYIARKWAVEDRVSTYEVFSLIPLKESYNLQNRYLNSTWNPNIFWNDDVKLSLEERETYQPVSVRDQYLFSVQVGPRYVLTTTPFNITIASLYAIVLVLFGVGLLKKYLTQEVDKRIRFGFLAVVGYWTFLKTVIYVFDFPNSLIGLDLFDPQYFAVSWFERSFADMLINTFFIFILAIFIFFNFRQFKIYKTIIKDGANKWIRPSVGMFVLFATFFVINYQYLQLRTIYFNSQISLDITQSLTLDKFRALAFLLFVIVSVSTGIFLHVSLRVLHKLLINRQQYYLIFVGGTLLFVVASYFSNLPTANLVLVSLFVVVLLLVSQLPQELRKWNYRSVIYILILMLFNAGLGSWCIEQFEYERALNNMRKYAGELVLDSDNLAEFLIDEAAESIASDPFIVARMTNPFLSKESIIKKIHRQYLNSYLDKYDVSVLLYFQSGEGVPGYGSDIKYADIEKRYNVSGNSTEYDNLFFAKRTGSLERNRYIALIPLIKYDKEVGYIILEFKQNKVVPAEVYPELLKDNRFVNTDNSAYSYAIYVSNILIQKHGTFEYPQTFNLPETRDGWLENGYWHLAIPNFNNEIAVVSLPAYLVNKIVSNFSFLLIVLLVPLGFTFLMFALLSYQGTKQLSYTAKIQTYLNLAFFIPLLIVTVTTLSLITNSFKNALIQDKQTESQMLADKIVKQLDDYLIGGTTKEDLNEKLVDMVAYGQIDANIYGVNGKLITSTQLGIFSESLLSSYMNADVLQQIVETGNLNSFQEEQIGDLNYYTAYSAIKSNATDRLLGIVGIPFFRSESTLQKSRIDALTTILNLFVLIFLVALIATFFTSKWLTYPLNLIRQKLEHVSFAQHNDPLHWDSDDEIGLLVNEYNNMLLKLEESKGALARSQKESAWREVAQQVAHEIKNPLTPMKLTIQKLQRSMGKDSKSSHQLARALQNLLGQLNTLNDIVTSFSEFAKMPIPKSEQVDVIQVVKEVCSMFSSDKSLDIELHFHAEKALIMSDKKLMGRIISNMLINSKQSRKETQPQVKVEITTDYLKESGLLRLSFKDNGRGIPAEIKDRIFMPKFSTKDEGSGIGLAVAKHGVEHGGGSIWVESTENEGTTFIIEFPAKDATGEA